MNRKKDKHSKSDETALFRETVAGVKPLSSRTKRRKTRAPRPHPRRTPEDRQTVLQESRTNDPIAADIEAGEALLFHRPKVSRLIMRRLRRGQYSVQEEMDLHGMTAPEARLALHDFIVECSRNGVGCVRVVHGKGLRSGQRGAVLKAGVNHWLPQWQEVLAFCSALPRDGGTGAIYVLLDR